MAILAGAKIFQPEKIKIEGVVFYKKKEEKRLKSDFWGPKERFSDFVFSKEFLHSVST